MIGNFGKLRNLLGPSIVRTTHILSAIRFEINHHLAYGHTDAPQPSQRIPAGMKPYRKDLSFALEENKFRERWLDKRRAWLGKGEMDGHGAKIKGQTWYRDRAQYPCSARSHRCRRVLKVMPSGFTHNTLIWFNKVRAWYTRSICSIRIPLSTADEISQAHSRCAPSLT